MDSIDCVMVLIKMGVNINQPNSMGFTPLFLAQSLGRPEIAKLLNESNAKLYEEMEEEPEVTALEVYPESRIAPSKNTALGSFLGTPHDSTSY
jgi:ankyrin repeat protein